MNMVSAFLISLGLSMDNMALSVAVGGDPKGVLPRAVQLQTAFLFVLAHLVLFSSGFFGGYELAYVVARYGKLIACAILVYLGGHMLYEAWLRPEHPPQITSISKRLLLALATSLDALFAGMGLGLTHVEYMLTLSMLGLCVFTTTLVGFQLGTLLGRAFGRYMQLVGGLILIGFGVKLLL